MFNVNLSASPTSVAPGGSATLAWDIRGGVLPLVSASLDNGIGPVSPVDCSVVVNPTEATDYTITVTDWAGNVVTSTIGVAVAITTTTPILQAKQTYITTSGTYTIPADYYSLTAIECIGAGGLGGTNTIPGSGGGGGGAYAKISALALVAGQVVNVQLSTPTPTAANVLDTWFGSAATVMAKAGTSPGASATGGQGGQAAASVGTVTYSGGSGGNGSYTFTYGGGGGGAAGPHGNGNAGSPSTSLAGGNGGSADAGFGGAGGLAGNPPTQGGQGTEYGSVGSGGGGGGSSNNSVGSGYGGQYGGGGAGGSGVGNGEGGGGLIVFSYEALLGYNTTTTTYYPITGSLSADDLTIYAGSSTTLRWTSSNATAASINQGIGSVALSGSQSVSTATTTTYTLTLTAPNATTVTRQVTVTVIPLLSPTNVVAVSGCSGVSLSWAPPASPYTGFAIFRDGVQVGTSSTPSYVDVPPLPWVNHTYTVETLNNSATSGQSTSATAMMYAAMPQVTGVVVTPRAGGIVVAWAAVAHATSYTLYRGISPTSLVSYDAGLIGLAIFDLVSSDQTYYYAVAAGGPCGTGPLSAVVSGVALPTTPCAAIEAAGNPSASSANLTESASTFANAANAPATSTNLSAPSGTWE